MAPLVGIAATVAAAAAAATGNIGDGVRRRRAPSAGVVYVVAKAPRAGASKTRLCPPLTFEEAAGCAAAFLGDALDAVRQADLDARVICRDAAERDALAALLGCGVHVDVQEGSGLGEAMESAFRFGLRDGYPAVAVLGADCPIVPRDALAGAFDAVRRGADLALGPSEDGGYYLLVARDLHPRLFRDMVWSTDTVAAETLARCRAQHLRTHHAPPGYDVDDATSLGRLWSDVQSALGDTASRTRALLGALPGDRAAAIVEAAAAAMEAAGPAGPAGENTNACGRR
jgi:rSAM/selenodomain-associated transferase 1